jgi:predicted hydrocarbon binding protein
MIHHQGPKIANSQLRLTLLGMQQVLGEQSTQQLIEDQGFGTELAKLPPDDFELKFPAQRYAKLLAAVESSYANQGARILTRIGRSTFHQVLREQPNWMSSAHSAMGLLKAPQRIVLILEGIIDAERKFYAQGESWIEQKNGQISFIEQNCLVCCGRQVSSPTCHLRTGYLNEATRWATDVEYQFQETACIATGDPYCRFSVDTSRSRSTASSGR